MQRLRYVLAGFAAPLLLLAWSVLAIAAASPSMLGQLMEAMFFLVGWHYVKQGFGMLNVVSARRGVRYSASERRVLLAHCFSAWAFAWANPSLSAIDVEEKGVVYRALPHPALLEGLAGAVLVASSLALVVTLFRKWRREGSFSLYPLAAFLVTIWLWTIFTSVDPLLVYVIPALHSVQYLYFVWLLRRNQASAAEVEFGPPVRERLLLLAVGALALGARSVSPVARPARFCAAPDSEARSARPRRDAVVRGAVRVRQHPPLPDGCGDLAPGEPRDQLSVPVTPAHRKWIRPTESRSKPAVLPVPSSARSTRRTKRASVRPSSARSKVSPPVSSGSIGSTRNGSYGSVGVTPAQPVKWPLPSPAASQSYSEESAAVVADGDRGRLCEHAPRITLGVERVLEHDEVRARSVLDDALTEAEHDFAAHAEGEHAERARTLAFSPGGPSTTSGRRSAPKPAKSPGANDTTPRA